MKIFSMKDSDAARVASLHIKALPGTVSSKIGHFYLTRIYSVVVKNKKNNTAFIAKEKEQIVGVVVATSDLKLFSEQFRKELSLKDYGLIALSVFTFKITPFEILNRIVFENLLIKNYKKSYASITILFVNKNFRKNGIGSALVKKILNLYSKKVKNIYVDTLLVNKKAINFYQTLGFKEQKKIKDSMLLQYKS